MPKPFATHPGSGMHTHMSLFDGDSNAFYEAGAPYQLSKVGTSVHRRPPAPRRGDHRRHQPVGQPPTSVSGVAARRRRTSPGHNNRSAMVRVPMYKPTKGQSSRVEVRTLDAACNPYPSPSRSCCRRGSRASRRTTPCRPRPRTTCGPDLRRAPGHGHRAAAHLRCTRRSA